ncbi:MAG TPA: DNA-binding protein [Ruminococcus sp.]|jgi:predicted DNA-binding protein YlxM (UPF0122 family)|nr:DNA-binding protein [Ruminococcus sp.]
MANNPKDLRFVMLLDCYGDLLTEHQRSIMELYYCEDLSLSEIGEPLGITRQAVRSIIKRTEALLTDYEDKLRFAERLSRMRECFGRISSAAGSIEPADIRSTVLEEVKKGLELL